MTPTVETGYRPCECGCGANVRYGRRLCLRTRLAQRIATLTRRLDSLRENRGTKGFRTVWESRERLREELASINQGGAE
jgi:hypothetical protein